MENAIVQRATHLLQRWRVTVYNLSYEYDEEGLHELRHRELKRKLEVVKTIDPAEILKDGSNNEDGTLTLKEDELIRKAPNGRFIMFKSNFDFLEKPKGYLESDEYLNQHAMDFEESKIAASGGPTEIKTLFRGGKNGKSHQSAKSLISGVIVNHSR
jgi:hypothetical protein